ncbi:MAG: hypothetical protein JWN21_816 [Sphingomonas bacterium]|uniref:DUF4153 domain-containing protein n=1 Tax=Sphingomonas bacterium TaxID=1895847 RepID=UPI002614CFCD|nr:DUF4153 domain-containing protein [Sphingomonas bacterium]MDB5695273.1 hypothetical protein [Sphingomonas bacterium]
MSDTDSSWRLRPVILALVGALAALLVQQLADHDYGVTIAPWRSSLAVAIGTAALAVGLALERVRVAWTLAFAALAGATAGLVHHWSGGGGGFWFGDWRYLSLAIALGIAVPLFQVARDEGKAVFPYAAVHGHAWTNALLWLAAWVFTGVVFLLGWLLSALFQLIGLRFLRDLLGEGWFAALLAGAALGGALGLLRERDRVVRLLQSVATAVLGVLAPVLAVGLVVFLLALPFTGLAVLWNTRAATATLLSAAAGALLLANAVIGDGPDDESRNPALRWAATALAACVLPISLLAAVATGLRLDQYGSTPERLWALVFVAISCAYGLAYLVALVRGRAAWAPLARQGNLRLAFGVAAVALVLATPLVSFNAIATNAQVARLKAGRVSPDRFDWAALQFDFGASGKAAVAALGRSPDSRIAARATEAGRSTNRYDVAEKTRLATAAEKLATRLTILPRSVPLPPALTQALAGYDTCERINANGCLLFYETGASEAFSLDQSCLTPRPGRRGNAEPAWLSCTVIRLVRNDGAVDAEARMTTSVGTSRIAKGAWRIEHLGDLGDTNDAAGVTQRAAVRSRRIEVRPVERRQVVIGGVPVGGVFD